MSGDGDVRKAEKVCPICGIVFFLPRSEREHMEHHEKSNKGGKAPW